MEARRYFLEKGYAGASMRILADRAFESAANLYNYFPSKETLYRAVTEEARNTLLSFAPLLESGRIRDEILSRLPQGEEAQVLVLLLRDGPQGSREALVEAFAEAMTAPREPDLLRLDVRCFFELFEQLLRAPDDAARILDGFLTYFPAGKIPTNSD